MLKRIGRFFSFLFRLIKSFFVSAGKYLYKSFTTKKGFAKFITHIIAAIRTLIGLPFLLVATICWIVMIIFVPKLTSAWISGLMMAQNIIKAKKKSIVDLDDEDLGMDIQMD